MNAQLFVRETSIREGGNTQLILAAVLFVAAAAFALLWLVNVIDHPGDSGAREVSYPIITAGCAIAGLAVLARGLWNKARRADLDLHIAQDVAMMLERQEAQLQEVVDRVRRVNQGEDRIAPENDFLEPDASERPYDVPEQAEPPAQPE